MMNTLIPLWIIGGPFVALVILSFSFRGPSAMGGTAPRYAPRDSYASREGDLPRDLSAPLLDPVHPSAPRRLV
jgi:hypothetical protein